MHGDTIISGIGQGYILTNCLQLAVMGARAATNREVMPRMIADDNNPDFRNLKLNPENIKNSDEWIGASYPRRRNCRRGGMDY